MKEKTWNYISGALLIIIGLIFIFSAETAFGTIVLIFGAGIVTYNVIKIIISLKSDNITSNLSIMPAIIGIVFGLILIGNKEKAVEFITLFIGLWFVIGGLSSLLFMIKTSQDKQNMYKQILKIIIGTISLITPMIPITAIGYVIGIILILSGITLLINKKENEVIYKVRVKK